MRDRDDGEEDCAGEVRDYHCLRMLVWVFWIHNEGEELTLMLPRRLATDDAGSMESAVMKLVMKNRVPSLLSEILNLSWKKNVIQELGNC